jgi:hypothetical protein
MKPSLPSFLLVCLVLALAATAVQAATSAPVSPAAQPAPAATVAPPSVPAWSPAILAGLPSPGEVKSEVSLPFLQPSFCPPPCIGCQPPYRCTGPCQSNSGCTFCACHR